MPDGHFAAWEQPPLPSEEVRAGFRPNGVSTEAASSFQPSAAFHWLRNTIMTTHIRTVSLAGSAALFVLWSVVSVDAACIPSNLPTPSPRDPVARVLAPQAACPNTAIAFRNLLKRSGARLEPTMVNFVGFHNPNAGAFFIFEIVSASSSTLTIQRGDLVFGHFTTATGDGRLVSNQSDLTIELIAWDPDKEFYNFYELVSGRWFYRGDSKDVLDDIQLLHRQRPTSQGAFGQRLRCSGCHLNGGLLQKELAAPHNDWFVKARPLPLGTMKPDASIKEILTDLVDAQELADLVAASSRRLADSPGYRKVLAGRSLQERLRPLFCPVEVNVKSDTEPFDDRKPTVRIPSGFFVDERLAKVDVSVQRQSYDAALKKLGSRLPETPGRIDADHAWLAPVKAQSDIVAVDALVEQGIIDREFVADVLAVDLTNPVFAGTRCGLLKAVPAEGGADFVGRFREQLRTAKVPGAAELLSNLTDPQRNAMAYQKEASAVVAECQKRASDPATVLDWLRLLAQSRAEVSASEISTNKRGHILEDPGRIVFPMTTPRGAAARLALTPTCQVK